MVSRVKKRDKGKRAERQGSEKVGSAKRQAGKQRGVSRRGRRIDRSRTKDTKSKRKGWLASPADWERFNAWARKNALPKKIPEPPPINRGPVKPLYKLRKKIKILSIPRKAPDMSIHCRLEWKITKCALNVVASRRLILLALPNVRLCDYGRVYYKVSRAALAYFPSRRICELSQPKPLFLPEECRTPLQYCEEKRKVDQERLRKLALAKKLLDCPQELTPEDIAELFTPFGTRRTALEYEITTWMDFLAVPMYKALKGRKDKNAKRWRKQIIEEGETRGKEALAEQKKREKRRREKERREREKKRAARRRGRKSICDEPKKPKKPKKRKSGGDDEKKEEGEEKEKTKEEEEMDEKAKEEEERKAKRRRMEIHAWRFVPDPCKDDPFKIKPAALKAEASPRTKELSEPREDKCTSIREDPFTVKKGALNATASPRVSSLAEPKQKSDPVEKKPPREKDKYGAPIFPKPVYGKVLPKTKPYKMGECPEKKEEKKKVVKKRPIDPIAYEPTYDPCIDPELAKRQKRERKRLAKLSPKKKKGARRKRQKRQPQKKDSKKPDAEEGEKAETTGPEEETETTEPEETETTEPEETEGDANEEAEEA